MEINPIVFLLSPFLSVLSMMYHERRSDVLLKSRLIVFNISLIYKDSKKPEQKLKRKKERN